MEIEFDKLVKQNLYKSCKLYHGTTTTDAINIEDNGIDLKSCRKKTDFNGESGFYMTADIRQAMKWAKIMAKRKGSTPAVVRFKIDRQELEEICNYKRFEVGEYNDWCTFTEFSRAGYDYNTYDVVEGPYRAKNKNNCYNRPRGHQLGLFSEDVVEYFDAHIISMSKELPLLLKGLSLD